MKKMFAKITAGIVSAAMLCGVGFVSAKVAKDNAAQVKAGESVTSILTIASSVTTSPATLEDDAGNSYEFSTDGSLTASNSYIQGGTNKSSVSYLRLVSDSFNDYTIISVSVWGTSKASTNVTPKVYIGGNLIGEGSAYTTQNASDGGTSFTANNTDKKTGSLKVEISRPSSVTGAIYFNKLEVQYETSSGSVTPKNVSSVTVSAANNNVTSGDVGDTVKLSATVVYDEGSEGDGIYTWNDPTFPSGSGSFDKTTELLTMNSASGSMSITATAVDKSSTGASVTSAAYVVTWSNLVEPTTYPVVTSADDLHPGDIVYLANSAAELTATGFNSSSKKLTAGSATFSDGKMLDNNDALQFTLEGSSGAWKLKNENNYLGAISDKTDLTFANNVQTLWNISIDSNGAATMIAINNSVESARRLGINSGATPAVFGNYATSNFSTAGYFKPMLYKVYSAPVRTLSSITAELTDAASAKQWFVGETVSANDLVVTAHYSDDFEQEVTPTLTNNVLSSVGDNSITVSYLTAEPVTVVIHNVIQPVAPIISTYSITDVLALESTSDIIANKEVINISGYVSSIVEGNNYGNLYIKENLDDDNSLYVYGCTKDATKLAKTDSHLGYYTGKYTSGQNFNSALVVGDYATFEAIVLYYNGTIEIQGVITDVQAPDSVSIDKTTLSIEQGSFDTITATSSKTVEWSSSLSSVTVEASGDNDTVATVSVSNTATAGSTATITATVGTASATCVVTVLEKPATPVGDGHNYEKVTNNLDDFTGRYLIVCESQNVAFDGGLSTLDAASNTKTISVSNNVISLDEDSDNYYFDVTANSNGGYSIKSASGLFIGVTSYSNALAASSNEYSNDISATAGVASISKTFSDGTMSLKYNKSSGQTRFRYYKSGQENIQLFKLVEEETPSTSMSVICDSDIFEVYESYEITLDNVPSWGTDILFTTLQTSLVTIKVNGNSATLEIKDAGEITIQIDVYSEDYSQYASLKYVINSVYTANSYGADVLAFAYVMCEEDGTTSSDDIVELWDAMENQYDSLSVAEKNIFVETSANQGGSNAEKGAALYDYVFAKYGTSLSLNNFANRSVASSSPAIKPLMDDASGVTTIVTVTAISSITLVGGFALTRKRKHF